MTSAKYFCFAGIILAALTTLAAAGSPISRHRQAQQGISQHQADEILNELREIRTQLEKLNAAVAGLRPAATTPGPPQRVQLSISDDWHSIGKESAPVTVMEFVDYQCPFCRRFHSGVFPELKKNYIDVGKVRFISRDLPLDSHPFSMKAAEAVRCAGDQGKYWEMRDALLRNSAAFSDDMIAKSAEGLSIGMADFRACLSSGHYKTDVQKDSKEAATLQIVATPTFVLAKSGKDKLDGVKVMGALSYAVLQSLIDQMLKN